MIGTMAVRARISSTSTRPSRLRASDPSRRSSSATSSALFSIARRALSRLSASSISTSSSLPTIADRTRRALA